MKRQLLAPAQSIKPRSRHLNYQTRLEKQILYIMWKQEQGRHLDNTEKRILAKHQRIEAKKRAI